jgi:hypothetical protein
MIESESIAFSAILPRTGEVGHHSSMSLSSREKAKLAVAEIRAGLSPERILLYMARAIGDYLISLSLNQGPSYLAL